MFLFSLQIRRNMTKGSKQYLRGWPKLGTTLNPDKCSFKQPELKFLRHVLNKDGMSPDPEKTEANRSMPLPKRIPELHRFLRMANQLAHKLADLTTPLRELLSVKNSWNWGPAQEEPYQLVKEELSKPTVLALYDPQADTKISADSSSYGLGAVLMQISSPQSDWKPIAYASRALTDTESRYTQVDRGNCLYLVNGEIHRLHTWQKLHYGDRSQASSVSARKQASGQSSSLDTSISAAVIMILLCNKSCPREAAADTLPRNLSISTSLPQEANASTREVKCFVSVVIASLPASADKLAEYKSAQAADFICQQVIQFCCEGCPEQQSH